MGAMPTRRTRGYFRSLAAPSINRGHPPRLVGLRRSLASSLNSWNFCLRPVAVLKEMLIEGVSELDTRPTPSPARTADPTSEHIASVAERSDGDWYGREPHAAARRDKIIGACFDEACRPLSNWRRRSSRAAVQHAPHHRSTRLALGAEAAYRAGSIPGVRRQRVCMTAIPKLLFAEDVSCKK
jgi:hypothetical protein